MSTSPEYHGRHVCPLMVRVIPGAVHRSPDIHLTAEENPVKPELGDSLMKAVGTVIASNGVPYHQIRSVEKNGSDGLK